jgi:phage shock protein A
LLNAGTVQELKSVVEQLCVEVGEIQDQLERLKRDVSAVEAKASQAIQIARR